MQAQAQSVARHEYESCTQAALRLNIGPRHLRLMALVARRNDFPWPRLGTLNGFHTYFGPPQEWDHLVRWWREQGFGLRLVVPEPEAASSPQPTSAARQRRQARRCHRCGTGLMLPEAYHSSGGWATVWSCLACGADSYQ